MRTLLPGAQRVEARTRAGDALVSTLLPIPTSEGLFVGPAPRAPYYLRIAWPAALQDTEDPYSFGPILDELELTAFSAGSNLDLGRRFGAQPCVHEGIAGVSFVVWAPNALHVAVVGDFNAWDGRRHRMRLRHRSGVWELFVPRLSAGELYKYQITVPTGASYAKADPCALATQLPPATASVVRGAEEHVWSDRAWMSTRLARHAPSSPLAIYEVHTGSWRRLDGRIPCWDELAATLPEYVSRLGFTHVELMPVAEHPYSGSWGYQPTGLFAPTSRHGPPRGFSRFVDACHAANLGVIVDWVAGHFPRDAHGLARFDGTALYEHEDRRQGEHPDWGTLIYNHGRHEVAGFLLANALHWLREYHVDGLRVDAVASMLYRDYSRSDGDWIPNHHGGRENLEAIEFLRRLNEIVQAEFPGVLVMAEESTAWGGVTAARDAGGLGFTHKWNMGWMNDTLRYFRRDPVHRAHHHHDITFGLHYAFSERFVLPLSHDEVVHGKGSLLGQMPGSETERFANLRALYAMMWAHPGKKLLFMGDEFAQHAEWNHDQELAWGSLGSPLHLGMQTLIRDLNRAYTTTPALHAWDAHPSGFTWLVGDDTSNSVFAWLRRGPTAPPVCVIANLTPVTRLDYRVGVPSSGWWGERLNTDSVHYGGGNQGNHGGQWATSESCHGHPWSLRLTLPPLSVLFLEHGHP